IARTPAAVDANVAAVGPAQLPQPLQERRQTGLAYRIVLCERHEHADASHPLTLLRARRERPCRNRTTHHFDEVAPSHAARSGANDHANAIQNAPVAPLPAALAGGP